MKISFSAYRKGKTVKEKYKNIRLPSAHQPIRENCLHKMEERGEEANFIKLKSKLFIMKKV
jgi:hypothetical protein